MQLSPSIQGILVRATMDSEFRKLLWSSENTVFNDVTAQELAFIRANKEPLEQILQGLEQRASSLAMADFCTTGP